MLGTRESLWRFPAETRPSFEAISQSDPISAFQT
jgi:hypothetical protein